MSKNSMQRMCRKTEIESLKSCISKVTDFWFMNRHYFCNVSPKLDLDQLTISYSFIKYNNIVLDADSIKRGSDFMKYLIFCDLLNNRKCVISTFEEDNLILKECEKYMRKGLIKDKYPFKLQPIDNFFYFPRSVSTEISYKDNILQCFLVIGPWKEVLEFVF